MKKVIFSLAALLSLAVGVYLIAADHIDAPAITVNGKGTGLDITDVYGFQSPENASNLVLVCNTQGLLSPTATQTATFDANGLIEFNIDNNNDKIEDFVIQCTFTDGKMQVYGPATPVQSGKVSTLLTSASKVEVAVTAYNAASPTIATNNGVKVFAGPRDDPFFFDLVRFKEVIAGTQTAFRNPGVDTFAGTNVMSIVVEVPKALFGVATNSTLNVWAESKSKD